MIQKRQPTDILCPHCQEANFEIVEPFGEAGRAARCPKCWHYYYRVGGIICLLFQSRPTPEEEKRLDALLGSQELQAWAKDHIDKLRQKLDLPL